MANQTPPPALTDTKAAESYGHVVPLLRTLKHAGHQAFLVGGGIRDLLLLRSPGDWDVATSARPEELLQIWPKAIPTGLKHGTVTVLTDRDPVEVTSFRDDGPYTDGRRPDWVNFGVPLNLDLARRDFTMNALAFDPLEAVFEDPFKGLGDLRSGTIRTVGDPDQRFKEDGLRPLRGVRLAAVLEFTIVSEALSAMTRAREYVAGVAKERVRDEVVKMLKAPRPSRGLELLRRVGLLDVVIPELMEGLDMPQNRFHAYDVYRHILSTLDAAPPGNLRVRLAALFHDIAKPRTRKVLNGEGSFIDHQSVGAAMTRDIMERLRFPRKETEAVCHLVKEHMFHYTPEWTDAAVRRFVRRVGSDHLSDLFALRRADNVGNGLKEEIPGRLRELQGRVSNVVAGEDAVNIGDLAITGEDVMEALNISPGPAVGAALEELLEMVLEDPSLNTAEKLMNILGELHERS